MALKPERKGLYALQEQESVEGGYRSARIAEEYGANVGDEGGGADDVVEGYSVIARVGGGYVGVFPARAPIELSGLDYHSAEGSAVTAQKLRCGMYDYIGAVLYRADEIGGPEGVVYHEGETVLVGYLGYRVDIGNVAVRISKGLKIYRPRVLLYRRLDLA